MRAKTAASGKLAAIFVVLMVVLGLQAPCGLAQSESASVSGRVTDQSNAVVPDVEVEIRNPDTGVSQVTKTNGDGFYVFPYLSPGNYVMSVRKQSFQTVSVTGMTLNVQDNVSRNFVLKVGSSAESVTVEANGLNINTTDGSVSTVIDRQFVDSIPLNGRSLQPLITLAPGVVLTPATDAEQGQFSVNGQRADANYFMVDGVSANFGVGSVQGQMGQAAGGATPALNAFGGTNSLVSLDAIQEFRIQTSSYAPEFGRTPGGQVSIVTRSGSNQFHGDAFDYFRNTALDAANWFNGFTNNPPLPKPPEHQNDFGGVFGGPIWKDKTFFFFSYEGLRLLQPTTGEATVPTKGFRSSPAVPAALLPLVQALPLPNGKLNNDYCLSSLGAAYSNVSCTGQFNGAFSNPTTLDATSMRIDHKLNERIRLFARYNYAPSQSTQRIDSLSTETHVSSRIQTLTLGTTQVLNPSWSNDFRFNYSYARVSSFQTIDSFGGAVPPAASVLFPTAAYSSQNAVVGVDIIGAGQFGMGKNVGESQTQKNVLDSANWSLGTHELKFGVDYRRLTPVWAPSLFNQNIFFVGLTGSLGLDSGTIPLLENNALSRVGMLAQNLSLYGQDTWKLNSRVTLTYGLRWELNPPLEGTGDTPIYTLTGVSDPNNLSVATPGTSLYHTKYSNFAPRVGVAARLNRSQGFERVLRAGFGTFYDIGMGSLSNGGAYWPYARTAFLPSVPYPIPASDNVPPPFSTTLTAASGGILYAASPDLDLPRTYGWNVAFEQSLGQDQALTITYVGAVGRDLLREQTYLFTQATTGIFPIITSNSGSSNYNALQLQYQRRLRHGLQALAFYSFSHSIDNGSNDSSYLSNSSHSSDRGNSDFDIRHSFHGAVTYDIPVSLRNRFGNAVLKGWALDTIVVAQSAPPVDLKTHASVISATETFNARPDIVPGQAFYLYGSQYPGGKAINPAAFTNAPVDPTTGLALRQGTLGRNVLRGFGVTQVDLAVRRQFPLREAWSFEFSAEAFNLLNHPNFGDVDNDLSDYPGTFGQARQMLGSSLGTHGAGFNPLYQVGGPRSLQLALKLRF